MPVWQNRIIGHGSKPASEFAANPSNWRTHPEAQQNALRDSLEGVGWVGVVLENVRTGNLIDGHERVASALKNGNTEVPYIQVDLSLEEELYILTTLDPIGAMAGTNAEALDAALAQIENDNNAVQELLTEIEDNPFTPVEDMATYDDEEPAPIEPAISAGDVPDAIWPTDNEWGIPLLDINLQAQHVELPLNTWGGGARSARMSGTYHFYTDDYRFEALWKDPSPVVNSSCAVICEPNFSTNAQMPRAVVLWHTYRKRWLARYWQEQGTRIFVDLDVHKSLMDINLLGVPFGWRAYSFNMRPSDHELSEIIDVLRIGQERAGTEDILLLIIGGEQATRDECLKHSQCVWLPSYVQQTVRGDERWKSGGTNG